MAYWRPILFISLPLLVLALAIGLRAGQPQPRNPPPAQAPVPHFIDTTKPRAQRILVVGNATEQLPGTSNAHGYLMANLRTGEIPAGASEAEVLSDSNCAPDADGISHCLNDLRIGNVVVTVQHHHDMTAVPCLSPGETVTLLPFTPDLAEG